MRRAAAIAAAGMLYALLGLLPLPLAAQELDARFSCSMTRSEDGERVIYADHGQLRLKGDRVEIFRWESALYRSTHGFDCSIDEGDGVQAEPGGEANAPAWRITLKDAANARFARGFDFARGANCSIRVARSGDTVSLRPSCPALCGSRTNFSELAFDLKSGKCSYSE